MAFHIDITTPHKLSHEEAWVRELNWLQSQNKPDRHVALLRTTLDHAGYTVQILLSAYGYPITVSLVVTNDHVHLFTSEATDVVEGLAMRWKQTDLQAQQSVLLK